MTPPEVLLLKENAELRQGLTAGADEKKKEEIDKKIQEKQMEFNLMLEKQKRNRKSR